MRMMIEKAQKWADDLWVKSSGKWIGRKQDLNYRKYVVRPALEKVLKFFPQTKNGLFLDLGCGNGSETWHIKKILERNGNSGVLVGIDRNDSFIKFTRDKHVSRGNIKVIFEKADIAMLAEKYICQADLITAIFVLQDLPDVEILFRVSESILKENGQGIFILVHPQFGQAMKEKGELKINTKLKSRRWKWMAKYPIVESGGKTFYVPYVHREIEDYHIVAEKYFKEVPFIDLRPSAYVINKSKRENILPFFGCRENVYFPEITEIPSSLIIKIKK